MTDGRAKPVEYRPIAGYSGYRVGDDGSVWSCRKRKRNGRLGILWFISDRWLELKQHPCGGSGKYLFVSLYSLELGIRAKQITVHRLVLEAFVGPRPAAMQCRHLNGDPHDNRLGNLRWGTASENGRDKVAHGRGIGESHPRAKLTADDVREMRAMRAAGMKYKDIGAAKGVHRHHARHVVAGSGWRHI